MYIMNMRIQNMIYFDNLKGEICANIASILCVSSVAAPLPLAERRVAGGRAGRDGEGARRETPQCPRLDAQESGALRRGLAHVVLPVARRE